MWFLGRLQFPHVALAFPGVFLPGFLRERPGLLYFFWLFFGVLAAFSSALSSFFASALSVPSSGSWVTGAGVGVVVAVAGDPKTSSGPVARMLAITVAGTAKFGKGGGAMYSCRAGGYE